MSSPDHPLPPISITLFQCSKRSLSSIKSSRRTIAHLFKKFRTAQTPNEFTLRDKGERARESFEELAKAGRTSYKLHQTIHWLLFPMGCARLLFELLQWIKLDTNTALRSVFSLPYVGSLLEFNGCRRSCCRTVGTDEQLCCSQRKKQVCSICIQVRACQSPNPLAYVSGLH